MAGNDPATQAEISRLAEHLLAKETDGRARLVSWLSATLALVRDKELLVIHNPGGWGSTLLEDCLDWEQSIVRGVGEAIDELGRSWASVQYFRSGTSAWDHVRGFRKEIRFFITGEFFQARVLAGVLRFLGEHLPDLQVVLVGASQGAAFSNTVMRQLDGFPRVYSIELGLFFPHMSHRVVTDRTLAVDSNGLMPDPMAHRDLRLGFKAYLAGFLRYLRGRLQGKPTRFTACVNVPGHEYHWEHPEVQRRIRDFLSANFDSHHDKDGGG